MFDEEFAHLIKGCEEIVESVCDVFSLDVEEEWEIEKLVLYLMRNSHINIMDDIEENESNINRIMKEGIDTSKFNKFDDENLKIKKCMHKKESLLKFFKKNVVPVLYTLKKMAVILWITCTCFLFLMTCKLFSMTYTYLQNISY